MNGTGSVHHSSLKTTRRKSWCTKVLSCTLVFALLVPAAAPAFAFEEETAAPVSCIHHPEHTGDCGYAEAVEETPCGHEHNEECGYAEEITPCTHQHDESCGYTPAAAEVPCDLNCAEIDEEGNVIHQEGCAYAPAVEETPCNHVHDDTCGYAVKVTSDCTHQHDESCGYREAVEGSPCTFACDKCVVSWEWVDEGDLLAWNEDAKLWDLCLPGVSEETPLSQDELLEFLPKSVTVRTAADTEEQEPKTVNLSWDCSNLSDTDVKPGSYTITASLEGDYALTDGAPALAVLVELGGAETYDETRGNYENRPVTQVPVTTGQKFVNGWNYVAPAGAITHTTERDYSMNVILNLSNYTTKEALAAAIKEVLPEKIYCYGAFWGNDTNYSSYIDAGLTFDKTDVSDTSNRKVYGWVPIQWDFSKAGLDAMSFPVADKTSLQLYAAPNSSTASLIRVNTNDPDYDDSNGGEADTAEAYDILNLKVTLKQAATSYPGPVQSVPVVSGKHKFVSDWEYVLSGGMSNLTYDSEHNIYSAALALSPDKMTLEAVKAALPKQVHGSASYDQVLIDAGFKNPSATSGKVQGDVDIVWSGPVPEVTGAIQDGAQLTFYAKPAPAPNAGYLLRVNTNNTSYKDSNEGEADTAEANDILNLTVTVREFDPSGHIVTPANPENVTVNLFDYYVEKNGFTGDDDRLTKNITDNADYDTASTTDTYWNKGINENRLLLFGEACMVYGGFWNIGAGAGRPWGVTHTNMKGIVESVLGADGYPHISLDNAVKGKDVFSQGDITNVAHAEDESGSPGQNLSTRVLNNAKTAGNGTIDNSLAYLFDPAQTSTYKTQHKDVKGLFQLDENGYYYYNMRENFAEFSTVNGNHFILYDAPAVWRTDAGYNPENGQFDGAKSLGNFFPFNQASQVFDVLTTTGDGKTVLSSSEALTNIDNAVRADHHLGMTVQVDFRQPANGMINTGSNAQPMTFQFSGDDDVWVFVDDVLVLDIGGIHSELYGTIDFSTGDVYIGQSWRTNGEITGNTGQQSVLGSQQTQAIDYYTLKQLFEEAGKVNTTQWTGNTFASNTSHTLKMFYLERGNYDSSLALRFNLQPLLYQQIKKVDQNGNPVSGVEFELYEAAKAGAGDAGAIQCLYTDSKVETGEFFVKQTGTKALVTLTTDANGQAQFLQSDGSYYNFADRGPQYYILKEKNAPNGYRKQPLPIVLHYDPATAMLSVANRWTTGAYACSTVHVTGQPKSAGSVEEKGLVVAVPLMQKKSDKSWLALYGSNLAGFKSVPLSSEADILLAALHQAQSGAADWHLDWDGGNSRLTGTLSDLPGLASRYTLIDPINGDMQMAYVLINAEALNKLGITGKTTPADRYQALQDYFNDSTHTPEAARDTMGSGFLCLETDTFNRDFRSLIYIPNERRELHVLKIDQDGKPLEGAEFGLYGDKDCTQPAVASGTTDSEGMLVFSPTGANGTPGQANMVWANSSNTQYYLKETKAPEGHTINNTATPIVVGTYGIYADAGTADNNVSVVADVGRLTQTMRQYAMDGNVDITLQDITAFMQTQESGKFTLNGWKDAKLDGTDVLRSMNLHFNKNQFVDYGLHDEDGGKGYYPFFVTNTGYIRTRVEQNQDTSRYEARPSDTNKDKLGHTDLTNLFSLLNIVVVTDRNPNSAPTGQLTISKKLTGTGLTDVDYAKLFRFKLELKDKDGNPLSGSFDYRFYGKDKVGTVSSGDTLLLHHDESVTILGLPAGTTYTVTEASENGWHVTPDSGTVTGTIVKDQAAEAAFTNSKDPNNPSPPIDPDPDNPGPTPPSPPDDPQPTPTPPPDDPQPTPTPPPDDPGPTPTPPPDNPQPTPTLPVFPPLYPTLPDPNDPNSPDEVTIWEDDVPITYIKVWDPVIDEWVYIPEGDIPKISLTDDPVPPVDPVPPADSTVPPTGDISLAWYLVFGAALTGLIALLLKKLLRKEA